MTNMIIGLYGDMKQAHEVITGLKQAGFSDENISLMSNETQLKRQQGIDNTMRKSFGKLETHKLPGIGNVAARGPLTRYLGGQTRLSDALREMGARSDEADAYLEALRRGNTLVAVNADEGRSEQAVQIMSELHALPTERLSEHWRSSGWKGFDERAKPYTEQELDREHQTVLPIIEEELRVGKREVSRGGVRIHSRMTEHPVEKTVDLREERVNVERRAVDRPVSDSDMDAFREGTFEVRATSEEPVVDKQARIVEEIVVDKTTQQRKETVRGTERHTEVDVENVQSEYGGGDFDRFDADFRRHFDTNYGQSRLNYEAVRPAYRYGYDFAGQYQGRDWKDAEMGARQAWESRHPDTPWENVKHAVREGFEKARRAVS